MSDWTPVTLADLVDHVDERRGEQDVSLVLSVTERRGIMPQTEVFNKRIATENTAKYKVLQPLDIAYNPYLLWKAAIGQWAGSEPGVTSPVYETFRTRQGHDPRFVGLVLTSGVLTPYFDATAIGSIQRRRRTTPSVFLAAETSAPPLPEQRRIVAVMSAVDAHIEALAAQADSAGEVLDCLLSTTMSDITETAVFKNVATARSGPSWAAADEAKSPANGAIRVIKITNTKSDGRLDMTDVTYVTGLPGSTSTLSEASIVVIRTNGNRNRIGNVYRPTQEALGCAVSAFQFIANVKDPDDRDFVYWALRDPIMQIRMSTAASGSTGLGNLAVRWLNTLEIPWADHETRAAVVARMDAAEAVLLALSAELTRLRILRSGLLSALLSREITVDEAVDQFVPEAA